MRTVLGHFSESTTLLLEILKILMLHIDGNNDYERANNEIHAIKDKLKELDVKQTNEINDIENFFGLKDLN